MGFCKDLEELEAECSKCYENGIGACHYNIGIQDYYKGFALHDTINIIKHNGLLTIETDIEVTYETKFPYGIFAGKGAQFAMEYAMKDKNMKDFLGPKLPEGVTFLRSHQHYNPDKHDPDIVAIHIHANKIVTDLKEAKEVAEELVSIIKPAEITHHLKKNLTPL